MNIDRYILWGLMAALGVCVVMLASTPAKAQQIVRVPMPIYCGDANAIENIIKEAGKEIAWVGKDKNGKFAAFIAQNPESGEWTFYGRFTSGQACLVSNGEKGEFVDIPESKGY